MRGGKDVPDPRVPRSWWSVHRGRPSSVCTGALGVGLPRGFSRWRTTRKAVVSRQTTRAALRLHVALGTREGRHGPGTGSLLTSCLPPCDFCSTCLQCESSVGSKGQPSPRVGSGVGWSARVLVPDVVLSAGVSPPEVL